MHDDTPATAAGTAPRMVDSRTLLGGGRELLIEHNGETYRLRRTSKERLILTK